MFSFLKKQKDKKTKIALMSVADIDNYGDTLFPFIAEQEIKKRIPDVEFRFFTPTDFCYNGTQFYGYSRKKLSSFAPNAILVIGGEVIHKYDDIVWNEMYKNINRPIPAQKPSATIFDWLNVKNAFKAWFSVGVLSLGPDFEQVSDNEIKKLDYIGVRGILSKKNLEKHLWTYNSNIEIVPDIGWIFPRFVPDYIDILTDLSRKLNIDIEENNYIIFNTNFSAINKRDIDKTKKILSDFSSKTNLKILVLPVISTYKDSVFLATFCDSNASILMPENLTLREKAALLCGAKFYIGSSLHSAITTMAMSKPAVLIHDVELTKFQDLYSHSMLIEYLAQDWDNLESSICICQSFFDETNLAKGKQKSLKNYVSFMQSTFDYKMDVLCEKIMKRL